MANDVKKIVNKAWNFAHVLRDDGLSHMAYTEQITFRLFVRIADQLTRPPWHGRPIVPPELGWPSLLKRSARLRQSILKRVFEGQLVPQNPNEEPVSVLLERIGANTAIASGDDI